MNVATREEFGGCAPEEINFLGSIRFSVGRVCALSVDYGSGFVFHYIVPAMGFFVR